MTKCRFDMKNTRRSFLKSSAAGALGFTILPSWAGKAAPSDKVRVAHVGVGGMGNNHMEWFANLPEAEVVALCDVDTAHLGSTLKKLQEINPGTKARIYTDF